LALSKPGLAFFAALLTLIPLTSPAGNLQLLDSPLFLQTAVQPNIFFMTDDSGSMDWEVLLNMGATGAGRDDLDLTPATDEDRSEFCVGYNTLAYDPNATYTPWKGKDKLGSDFQDAHLMEAGGFTQIRRNPYCPGSDTTSSDCNDATNNGTTDLTDTNVLTLAHYTWTDADSDDAFDLGECGDVTNTTDATLWTGLSAAQQINYANWYSYYRKREYVVKRAASELITASKNRVGLSSLHNNQAIGTQIEDIDDISLPVNPTAQANKAALLNNLARVRSDGATPLRLGLENVGQYYQGISQPALFGSEPTHNTSETISALSPILNAANGGECQQNFTILLSDGFWNGGDPSVGNTDTDGAGPYDGPPYDDTVSNTLADVAMDYYERDLQPGLADLVPTSSGDPNPQQHMNTYTVAFGLQGTLDPFDTMTPGNASDTDPADASFVGWPTPIADDPTTLDDMWHAAYNGRGLYLNASNPGQLIASLQGAIASIAGKTGTAASVAANSGVLSTNSRVYVAKFTSGEWSGDLASVLLDIPNNQLGAEEWNAGEVLKTQDPSSGREIVTWNGSQGVPFRWGSLTTGLGSQQEMLDTNPSTGSADGRGSDRLNYLRGDHSLEGSTFRTRSGGFVLGDIIDSGPVFVGVPPFLYPDDLEDPAAASDRYSDFRGNQASRASMIYVGGNDGMLHGFDTTNGQEMIAYVPNEVFANLNELTDPGYNHRNYVNGSPTYGDAFYGGSWHSVIVGTLAGGGQGVFALDVTNPAGLTEANATQVALWEFTDANDSDLGFTYGPAVIVKTHNAGKWVAIFGNGYNNTEPDGALTTSTTGNAVLYIVDIQTGALIRKINTGRGMATSADGDTPNGLASPAVIDADADFIADYVFVGDLQGNMWKFDITDPNPINWGPPTTNVPLFTATDASSQPQPITVQPEVLNHATGENGFMVYFGTGKFIEDGDNATTGAQTQTFYGIWDERGTDTAPHSTVAKGQLQTQTITADTAGSLAVRTISNVLITAWGTNTAGGERMGFQVDLPDAGEKSVTNPIALGERMLFTTLIPLDSPCAFGGTGFLMEINIVNGGTPISPVFDLDGDGIFDDNDLSDNSNIVAGVNRDIGLVPQPAIIISPGLPPGAPLPPDCEKPGYIAKVKVGTRGSWIECNPPEGSPFASRRSWRQLQ
jgi:type IV pilus assembly protein PilY1